MVGDAGHWMARGTLRHCADATRNIEHRGLLRQPRCKALRGDGMQFKQAN
jgi:hypothetical protein